MASIAWLGLGNMGMPLSARLLRAGHRVTIASRSRQKNEELSALGAVVADSAAVAVTNADIVFMALPTPEVLCEMVLGSSGLAQTLREGMLVVDMSTVSIAASAKCAVGIEQKGALFLRAPVSGSTVLAEKGELTVFCSGPQQAYEQALPVLKELSKAQFYLGPGEEARTMKLALNTMVASTMQMLGETLALCEKAGMATQQVLDVISASVVASPLVQYKCPPLLRDDYTPAFTTALMAKDLDLALEAAKLFHASMPAASLTRQMLEAVIAQGNGELDFSALVLLARQLSGQEPR